MSHGPCSIADPPPSHGYSLGSSYRSERLSIRQECLQPFQSAPVAHPGSIRGAQLHLRRHLVPRTIKPETQVENLPIPGTEPAQAGLETFAGIGDTGLWSGRCPAAGQVHHTSIFTRFESPDPFSTCIGIDTGTGKFFGRETG